MYTANLNTLDLLEGWYENDPHMRVKVTFPFSQATGNASSAAVYFEIEPGHSLGTHTDSAEEIVLVLSGTVEASLGDEHGTLSAGQAILIPAMIPHGIRNVGKEKVRFLVNGTEVASQSSADLDTNGIAGLRVNHNLNVNIENFGAKSSTSH